MFIYRFCTVSNKPNENNKLKPITTVSIDLVLPKIDLEIEHVLRLKTHGVENRRRFSTSKIGADFRLRSRASENRPRNRTRSNRRRSSTPCVFSLSDV